MYAVTAKYLNQLRHSHAFYAYADLYYNGAKVKSNVGIADGSITVDRTQNIRRQGTLTLGDTTIFSQYVQSPLAPFGAELYLYHGIRFNDGTTEVAPIGIYSFESINKEESYTQQYGGLPVVSLKDRSAVLQRSKFLQPADYSGWLASAAVRAMVNVVLPNVSVTLNSGLTDYYLPGSSTYSSTRLDAVSTIVQAMGGEAYFDVTGNMQIVPIPALTQSTPLSAAVWTIDASTPAAQAAGASPYGVLVQANRGATRTGVFNAVAVYGASATNQPQPFAVAYDLDSRSPTRWGGPFGQSTDVVTNNAITTNDQAQTAANAALSNSLGAARSMAFTIAPNAALEAGDILKAFFTDGTVELHLLDSFQVPLNPTSGQFSGSTRTLTYQISAGQ